MRKRTLILILSFVSAFGPLATDMYLPAFAQMSQSFQVDSARIQTTLTTFFLGMAAGQLLYGPVLDRWGRRGPLLAGISIFVLATIGCLLAPDIESFSFFRVFQAIGGCAGMIVARAIVSDLFTPLETARTLSLLMMVVTLAPAAAPVVGGWLLALAGWHAIFWALLIYGLTCLLVTWWALPETMPVAKRQPMSVRSIASTYASLLRSPAFHTPALVGGLGMASLFAYITASSFVLIERFGLTEQQYGLVFGMNALGIMLASQVNRSLLRRWSVAKVLTAGLTLNLLAGACVFAAVATGAPLAMFAVALWFSVASIALVGSNAAALAMGASGGRAGSGSALVGATQFIVATVFSAVVSATHNGTAYPMASAMVAAPAIATALWLLRRRTVALPR
jgi:DHA1 family bicyclomycin/chloramphenicol resistance-like MFS transporter